MMTDSGAYDGKERARDAYDGMIVDPAQAAAARAGANFSDFAPQGRPSQTGYTNDLTGTAGGKPARIRWSHDTDAKLGNVVFGSSDGGKSWVPLTPTEVKSVRASVTQFASKQTDPDLKHYWQMMGQQMESAEKGNNTPRVGKRDITSDLPDTMGVIAES
jgi:hypothetical protein